MGLLLMLAALGWLGTTPSAWAQTGTIAGVLVDSETGETLIGANARIQDTAIGTATDIDGRFTIPNVEPGTYTLVFSYIGYNATTVRGVEVRAGETTRLELALTPESVALDEVVVEAAALENTEAALLRQRQKASSVSDAISAEAISRSGSSDAADAMEKVTGASVVGGKYVYVRGLGDRYASTQLNGTELPSADPDRKAVQFDLFPSNLLDNIVTLKTFTPDKPGNFSGGLIDIGTKRFPEALTFQVSASFSANTQATFSDGFLTYETGGTDWLATDDGTRDIPALLSDRDIEIPNEIPARTNPELAAELDAISDAFNDVMATSARTGPINQSYSLSLGNQTGFLGNPLGYIVGLTYGRSASFYDNGRTERYQFAGQAADDLSPTLLFEDSQGTLEASMGALGNVSYRLGRTNELGLNLVYTRTADSQARMLAGQWEELEIGNPNRVFVNEALDFTERQLYSAQLRGEHYLPGFLKAQVDWTGSYAYTTQDEPDQRLFAYTMDIDPAAGDTSFITRSTNFLDPTRFFRDLTEDSYNGKLDVTVPFRQWSGLGSQFKAGGAYQQASRDFNERIFQYVLSRDVQFEGDPGAYFSDRNMGVIDTTFRSNGDPRFAFGNTVREASLPENNYEGNREVIAGYGMVELPLTRKLRVVTGARLETTYLEVVSDAASILLEDSNPDNDEQADQFQGEIDEVDVLPSLNAVYQLQDNMNLRAAATRTLARPTIREIAPFSSRDLTLGDFVSGNPNLDRTLITNYDLRWEWFARPGEIFAVSGFYKDMQDPIERVILDGNGAQTFRNVERANVYGLELEGRSRLDRIHRALSDFSVGFNASFVRSEVNIDSLELAIRRESRPETGDTRDLQGQSPYLINADLSYENYERGTTAGLFFNVYGDRLSRVSFGATPDVYEQTTPQLDFTFAQRVFDQWTIKFSAKNLLDADYEEAYEFNDREFTYRSYERGRSFSLGISFSPDFSGGPVAPEGPAQAPATDL